MQYALNINFILACHLAVNIESHYEACMYEYCSLSGKVATKATCSIFDDYAKMCGDKSILLDWRNAIPACSEFH